MSFYCVGNWKLNKNPAQAAEFIGTVKKSGAALEDLVILPPALIAYEVAAQTRGTALRWGGQNSYAEAQGAFTGENSPATLRQMGAQFCLVGHSERRAIFGEQDDLLAKKVKALQDVGLTPILCVGETLEQRKSGRTKDIIVGQSKAGLKLSDQNKPLWLAYEPVWAIGTGEVATPEQVKEAHALLRDTPGVGQSPILYGGSVKADNAKALSQIPNVNGFLIGGASLKPEDLLAIQKLATAI